MSATAMRASDMRWFAGTQACAGRRWSGARLRAGWGRRICYLHCSCGHAVRSPSCLPALAEMFIFNSQEREAPRLQRGRVRPQYQQLKGNCSVSLPRSLQRSRLGWCWLERLKHLADAPPPLPGAGENVCVCLTVQNKREKQVGAGIEGVSEDQWLFDFYEAEQQESPWVVFVAGFLWSRALNLVGPFCPLPALLGSSCSLMRWHHQQLYRNSGSTGRRHTKVLVLFSFLFVFGTD